MDSIKFGNLIKPEKKVNIIFLDVDGVICTLKTRYQYMDGGCMELLKEIINETDAYIVVSSTWRKGGHFKELMDFFKDYRIHDRVLGCTPICHKEADKSNLVIAFGRGHEINEWLKDNKGIVRKYVILDDDQYDLKTHADFHVRTNSHLGMIPEDADKAIEILE